MGVIRAEPAKMTDWAARSIGAAWRAFDLQLAAYAALLAILGLVMAYTNSVEQGQAVLSGGTTFVRGLMWTGIALIAFVITTAFDYKWLKTFAWPLYLVQIGLCSPPWRSVTASVARRAGSRSGRSTSSFSELAKILMIVVLANYLGARQGRLGSLTSILGACVLVGPPFLLVMLQPDLGTSLVLIAILAGMLFMSGANLVWLFRHPRHGLAGPAARLDYVLRDYQKQRIMSFLNPATDTRVRGISSTNR